MLKRRHITNFFPHFFLSILSSVFVVNLPRRRKKVNFRLNFSTAHKRLHALSMLRTQPLRMQCILILFNIIHNELVFRACVCYMCCMCISFLKSNIIALRDQKYISYIFSSNMHEKAGERRKKNEKKKN